LIIINQATDLNPGASQLSQDAPGKITTLAGKITSCAGKITPPDGPYLLHSALADSAYDIAISAG